MKLEMHLTVLFLSLFLLFIRCNGVTLSCGQIKQFVDGHNAKRLKVAQGKVRGQPAATQMKHMVWDIELQRKASQWASRNQFKHNPDKTIKSGRFTTGQNLYILPTYDFKTKLNLNSVIEFWFEENVNFKYGPMQRSHFDDRNPLVGHYTQMVWQNSKYIGCAISKFTRNKKINFLVVCEYGPAGNIVRQKPYQAGKPSNILICDNREECKKSYGPNC